MFNKILLVLICILGIIALFFLSRDNPKFAEGEPTAIVQERLLTGELMSSTNLTPEEIEKKFDVTWSEKYIGHGKWIVARQLSAKADFTNLLEIMEEQRQSYVGRISQYTNDLPIDDRLSFLEGLWEYEWISLLNQPDDEWYVYEETGIVIIKGVK